jgi:ABC-2 type transport system ATP-binding protein
MATVHIDWRGRAMSDVIMERVQTDRVAGAGAADARGFAIEVEHVTKRYGTRTVVSDLSFVARPGRVTGFLGPNGAGKSTTMKIMVDLASADGGGITIGGRRYRDLAEPAATVGALLESNAFHPGRSGRNHLRILADADGIALDRVDEVLELVGLGDAADRRVGAYSLGMRQRLGFAGAILGDPPVLILDEPANGLDPKGIHEMRDLLRARAATGQTVLVSSHLLAEVELLADDVVVVNRGRLVTSGSLGELQEAATRVRASSPQRLQEVLEAHGAAIEQQQGALIVRGVTSGEIGQWAFDAGVVLQELSPHAGSLEDQFLEWTSDPDQPFADSSEERVGS